MNSNQINDSIKAGIYSKNVSYITPFSKGAYLAFVAQWKQEYARLSVAIRANKILEREFQRNLASVHKLTEEQTVKLAEQAKYPTPASIGFVQVTTPPYTPGWWPASWRLKATAQMFLVLRKQMKQEAGKLAAEALKV